MKHLLKEKTTSYNETIINLNNSIKEFEKTTIEKKNKEELEKFQIAFQEYLGELAKLNYYFSKYIIENDPQDNHKIYKYYEISNVNFQRVNNFVARINNSLAKIAVNESKSRDKRLYRRSVIWAIILFIAGFLLNLYFTVSNNLSRKNMDFSIHADSITMQIFETIKELKVKDSIVVDSVFKNHKQLLDSINGIKSDIKLNHDNLGLQKNIND